MATSTLSLNEKGEHLWLSLLALGFQPDTETLLYADECKIAATHIHLGPSMFKKPNKNALYIVIHFLLVKLNPTRFCEAYRNCWPVLTQTADAEFRKVTCAWLQEIMSSLSGSNVVTSLLLTPGGHKFVQLMLDLAKYVMLQDMQTFTTDESWAPDAVETSTSSLNMEMKRFYLVRQRFLNAVVDQDHLLKEYETQSQIVIQSMRELKSQHAKLSELPKDQSSESVPEEASLAEKIKKVRSLWSTIDEMLAVIKENQNAIEVVLKDEVDLYKLDGTDRVVTIPTVLLERIEQLPCQLDSGNMYEGDELNLLYVTELMNHALQLLKDERCCTPDTSKSQLSFQHLETLHEQLDRIIEDLALMKEKIAVEGVKLSCAIREQEADWDQRWMETLKEMPLASFLNNVPAHGFFSRKPFNLVDDEDGYKSSDLSNYSKILLEESEAIDLEEDSVLGVSTHKGYAQSPASVERPDEVLVVPQASRSNTSPHRLCESPPSEPVKTESVKPSQVPVEKKAHVHSKEAHVATKTTLDMEQENLAEQFADALMTASPAEGDRNGLKLEDVLDNLQRDPFSTRKQLPRTPESLITDVKRSWQKALKEDKVTKLQTVTLNDDIKQKPLPKQCNAFSPNATSNLDSSSIIFPGRYNGSQPKVLQSTLLWETFNMDVDGRAVLFSLENETLPELPSFDSLNVIDDVMKSDDEQPVSPLPAKTVTKVTPSPLLVPQACGDGSAPQHVKTPKRLKETNRETDTFFSLDLDKLETPSPLKQNSLPKLLTFSPIDDV